MTPLVSICCLTFNHGAFIKQFLDGVTAQETNFAFELLIYDDASTDNAQIIIEEYQAKFPEIVKPILNKTNQYSKGVRGLNMKYNFSRANGKYIALCEGDDYWISNDKLQKQVDFLENNLEFAGAYHDTKVIYQDSDKEPHLFRKSLPDKITAEDTIASIAPFHTSSFIFRKEAFSEVDWLYKIKSGDMAAFTIVASIGMLGLVPNLLSLYRKHETGVTNSELIKNTYHQDRIELMKHFDKFHDFKYSNKVTEVINFHQMKMDGAKPKQVSALQKLKNKITKRLT